MASLTQYLQEPTGLAGMGTQIDSYRQYFGRGKTIVPSKIDKLRDLYNVWIDHFHGYYDQYYIKYGNTYPQGTSGHSRDSSEVMNAPEHNDQIIAGRIDYKSFFPRFKDLTTYFNNFVWTHYHEVEDTSG